jgi:hypothetical protein
MLSMIGAKKLQIFNSIDPMSNIYIISLHYAARKNFEPDVCCQMNKIQRNEMAFIHL